MAFKTTPSMRKKRKKRAAKGEAIRARRASKRKPSGATNQQSSRGGQRNPLTITPGEARNKFQSMGQSIDPSLQDVPQSRSGAASPITSTDLADVATSFSGGGIVKGGIKGGAKSGRTVISGILEKVKAGGGFTPESIGKMMQNPRMMKEFGKLGIKTQDDLFKLLGSSTDEVFKPAGTDIVESILAKTGQDITKAKIPVISKETMAGQISKLFSESRILNLAGDPLVIQATRATGSDAVKRVGNTAVNTKTLGLVEMYAQKRAQSGTFSILTFAGVTALLANSLLGSVGVGKQQASESEEPIAIVTRDAYHFGLKTGNWEVYEGLLNDSQTLEEMKQDQGLTSNIPHISGFGAAAQKEFGTSSGIDAYRELGKVAQELQAQGIDPLGNEFNVALLEERDRKKHAMEIEQLQRFDYLERQRWSDKEVENKRIRAEIAAEKKKQTEELRKYWEDYNKLHAKSVLGFGFL